MKNAFRDQMLRSLVENRKKRMGKSPLTERQKKRKRSLKDSGELGDKIDPMVTTDHYGKPLMIQKV